MEKINNTQLPSFVSEVRQELIPFITEAKKSPWAAVLLPLGILTAVDIPIHKRIPNNGIYLGYALTQPFTFAITGLASITLSPITFTSHCILKGIDYLKSR